MINIPQYPVLQARFMPVGKEEIFVDNKATD